MSEWKEFLHEELKDPDLSIEYEGLGPEFEIVQAMLIARRYAGITQTQLAAKTGINQSDISRIENGDANPSLNTLKRLAAGMDMRLKLEFLPTHR